jgi:hypothetical protein
MTSATDRSFSQIRRRQAQPRRHLNRFEALSDWRGTRTYDDADRRVHGPPDLVNSLHFQAGDAVDLERGAFHFSGDAHLVAVILRDLGARCGIKAQTVPW